MAHKNSNRAAEIAKLWARILKFGSPRLARLSGRVKDSADLPRINRLRREMAETYRDDPTSAAKYADYHFWIPFNVCRIGALGLHKARPQRILDVGCGPGYFLAAARECGHECHGIDAPESVLTKTECRAYTELLGSLGCDGNVAPLLIERYIPMVLKQSDYDLITAFWICFNRHRQPDEWGVDEWKFFVEDSLRHLRRGGVIHLELNANAERYGPLEFYDQALLDFFNSVGTVTRGTVRIRKDNLA